MKTLLSLLFLAALAGAQGGGVQQPRSGLIFSDRNTYSGCYHASVRDGWKCIGGARPQAWMLLPIVEPLPPTPTHIWTQNTDLIVVDVPAIQIKRILHHKGDSWGCGDLMACIANEDDYIDVPTCADKSRVLLTDESGNRHCIKFGGTQ